MFAISHLVNIVNVIIVGRQGNDTCESGGIRRVPFVAEGLEIAYRAIVMKD